ncbi:UBX domain-containing protein 1-like [Melia azedarach]|uniref:UBX domain-containing protein 1-like n=1 Tax=Melia azedarach TaxID=155640 RepID=A0ACC1Y2Q5_MELAZ|nr:UBX domain-containing protein 1-like [Melia azedarach]
MAFQSRKYFDHQKLLKEVEALGFSRARAARALHCSGNANLEDAINWIIDHENDADIDEMPLIVANIEIESQPEIESLQPEIESPQPDNTTKEVEKKAQEIRDRVHQRKEEEKKGEKELERDREKERIRVGRELLEAKRISEENERKRYLATKKAEKQEEKRAREKVRRKIEADKVERRRQLGLPLENPTTVNSSNPTVQEKKNPLLVMTITKAEHMSECLRSLRRNYKGEDARVRRAFQTLLIYVGNVIKNPNEEKYRKIRLGNPLFQERVGSLKGGTEFLELCGFEKTEGADFLYLPSDKVDMAQLNSAASIISSALTNPFFGLLSV